MPTIDHAALAIDASNCRTLWIGVVIQAIRDATRPITPSRRTQTAKRVDQQQAIAFLRGGEDFRTVCELGGLDPDEVLRGYRSGRLNWTNVFVHPNEGE